MHFIVTDFGAHGFQVVADQSLDLCKHAFSIQFYSDCQQPLTSSQAIHISPSQSLVAKWTTND